MPFRLLQDGKKPCQDSNFFQLFLNFFHFDFLKSIFLTHIIYVKKLFFELTQFFITAFRLLYVFIDGGSECAVCSRLTFFSPVCKTCLKRYFSVDSLLKAQRCLCCGKELVSEKNKCLRCRTDPVLKSTDKVIPLFSYRLWNKELMFRWKMQGERTFSALFARLLNEVLVKAGEKIIVPVPPRKGKIRKNGWDQIDELCTFLEKRYGFRVLRVLERNSKEQQKKLNRSERLHTIKNSYSLCCAKELKAVLKPFSGKMPEHVCIIDDVSTTGATLESCAEILKAGGVITVNAVTLFTVD